ncbi:MAG: class I SAM-dependent methyltransferase [Pseudomonas oryzihabitans]
MLAHLASRYPLLLAVLVQLAALVVAVVGLRLWAGFAGQRPSLLALVCLQAVLAAALGELLGLARWWVCINLLFAPALFLVSGRGLSAGIAALGFLLLLLLNWNSLRERVPLYLTGRQTRDRLATLLAEREPTFRFVDLGCGLGDTLVDLARRFPQATFVGVETAPLSFALAWLRCLSRRNCQVRYRDLWRVKLGEFDVVYCFLSPAPMPRLGDKARAELRAGSWLISNTFEIPGQPADAVHEVEDLRGSRLLLWRR